MTTHLCLIRHGETEWNATGRIQGQLDIPLSAVGLAQADAVARELANEMFSVIYCSDLTRARQTAAPTAEKLRLLPHYTAQLRERHYGLFETLTYGEAKQQHPEAYERFKDRDPDFDFSTGESLRDFYQRSVACVSEITAQHRGERVLIFTHGGVLEMVRRYATNLNLSAPRDFEIPNTALNWIEVDADHWRIAMWSSQAHLAFTLDELPG
ncbi:MAG: histidine phosphatase family protein [Burkholderiales bacterium]